MEDSARGRPDANSPDSGGAGSIRAPTKGESSSSDAVPPSDALTSTDLPRLLTFDPNNVVSAIKRHKHQAFLFPRAGEPMHTLAGHHGETTRT